jgi:hypothetical protein
MSYGSDHISEVVVFVIMSRCSESMYNSALCSIISQGLSINCADLQTHICTTAIDGPSDGGKWSAWRGVGGLYHSDITALHKVGAWIPPFNDVSIRILPIDQLHRSVVVVGQR